MSDIVCRVEYLARRLHEPKRHRCVATRMSSATVYDRQLPLYFAAPRTYASSAADWVALLRLKAHVDSATLNAVVAPTRSHALPACKIRSAWCSAQRHQGGARRAGDSRGAECHVGRSPSTRLHGPVNALLRQFPREGLMRSPHSSEKTKPQFIHADFDAQMSAGQTNR